MNLKRCNFCSPPISTTIFHEAPSKVPARRYGVHPYAVGSRVSSHFASILVKDSCGDRASVGLS